MCWSRKFSVLLYRSGALIMTWGMSPHGSTVSAGPPLAFYIIKQQLQIEIMSVLCLLITLLMCRSRAAAERMLPNMRYRNKELTVFWQMTDCWGVVAPAGHWAVPVNSQRWEQIVRASEQYVLMNLFSQDSDSAFIHDAVCSCTGLGAGCCSSPPQVLGNKTYVQEPCFTSH